MASLGETLTLEGTAVVANWLVLIVRVVRASWKKLRAASKLDMAAVGRDAGAEDARPAASREISASDISESGSRERTMSDSRSCSGSASSGKWLIPAIGKIHQSSRTREAS